MYTVSTPPGTNVKQFHNEAIDYHLFIVVPNSELKEASMVRVLDL